MDVEGLSVICAGLGFAEEDDNGALIGYTKSEYCLDNLKDLARFLRRDDAQQRKVFKQICKWNTVSKDLVPIIEYYQSDRNLVINAVKILVFLTMPIDPSSDDIGQQMEYLWELKNALTRHVTIAVIVSLLEDPLSHLESDTFTEEDWKLVQLVLTLFRNLLAIQDITPQQRASGSATRFLCLADRFLELMFQENVMDLILVLTQHVEDSSGFLQEENLLLLEIFYYVFLGRDAEMIAKISKRSSKDDETIEVSTNSLRSIMEEEAQNRRVARLRNLERHSQFSGTFTRLNMDGAKTLFKRNPKIASASNLIKAHRPERGPIKKIAPDHGISPSPNKSILEFLNNFLNQLLSGGYNVLMQSICDDIRKEHQSIQKNDIIMFFRVVHFALAFQHQKVLVSKSDIEGPPSDDYHEDKHADVRSSERDVCGPVSASINETMFNLVISKWREAFEGLKETNDHKTLSAAGSVMKNMFRMLDLVLRLLPEDSKESQIARVLLYKLLYDQTDQGLTQFLFNLFKSFDSHKQPKSDLADLLETIHVLLRLMEKLQTRGTLRVAKKSRKGRKKKILNDAGGNTEINKNTEHKSPESADQTGERGERTSEFLLRPDNADQTNGPLSESIQMDKESNSQQGTSVSNLAFESSMHKEGGNPGDDVLPMDNDKGKFISPDTTDSSDDQLPATSEVNFNISRLIASFANNVALHNLCWLLKFYKSNTMALNHYIISMLQRFCNDLELAPMLYQLSILTVFYDILSEQRSTTSGEFASIVNFLTKIIRNMMKLMKKRPLLFVEILFWKTRRECHLINAEALLCDLANVKKGIQDLNTDTVGVPYNRFMPRSIADSLGDDEADIVVPYDLNARRDEDSSDEITDHAFCKTKQTDNHNVKSMLNDVSAEDMSENEDIVKSHRVSVSRSRKNHAFDQEQETMIKTLFENYKDDRKCSRLIAEALDPDGKISPVQVYRKLKQLGLQIGTKKRLAGDAVPCSTGDDPFAEGGHVSTDSANPSTSKRQENTSFGKYSGRRKRVQVFSEEQELEIKNLFERFKDHKKCSHMMAKALDADNKYTSAQVSRKLKQLGLLTTKQQKSSESLKHPKDKDSLETSDLSDDETLLSMIQSRGKKKGSSTMKNEIISKTVKEDQSEDETLGTMLQNQRKKVKLSAENAIVEEKVSDYHSDKEILRSMLKSRSSQQLEQLQTHGDEPENLDILDDDIEVELENPSFKEQEKHLDLMHLEESDDETYPSMHKKSGNKRNLKLVIDEEDE